MAMIEGYSGTVAEIEAPSRAQRVTLRPLTTLGWNSLGEKTGAITGLAANGCIFSFRNLSANLILVRRIGIGFMTTTAFTVAQALDYGLYVARNFSINDSAGTDITPSGNNGKHRTSFATPASLHVRISAAAVLTPGTRILDANAIGIVAGGSAGLATGLPPVLGNLFDHAAGDHPLVLAQNEGFVINNLTAMGAVGVCKAYVNVEYAEIAAF